MEAVAADVVFAGDLDGDGVIVRFRRHGAVEGGLKRADEWGVRQKRAELADGGQIRRVVRRSDGAEGFHFGKDVVCQILHAADALRQNDLEADAVQLRERGQDGILQLPQHALDGFAVRGEDSGFVGESAGFMCFGVEAAGRHADALRAAGGDDKLFRHAEKLIFEGRAAHVADQDIHVQAPCAFFYTVADGGRDINAKPFRAWKNRRRRWSERTDL